MEREQYGITKEAEYLEVNRGKMKRIVDSGSV